MSHDFPLMSLAVLATSNVFFIGSRVMMFTTPPMALAPNKADPPPRITSMRSIIETGICSSPYTPANALNTGRLSMRICAYFPSKPLILTWLVPQFWQVFSTLNPGWKFSPSAKFTALTRSKALGFNTLTTMAASRRSTATRLADTTTSPITCVSVSISKLSSLLSPRFTRHVSRKPLLKH